MGQEKGPDRIFEMASFWKARALQTAVVMGVFDALADGPRTAVGLARRFRAKVRSLELLLNARLLLLAPCNEAIGGCHVRPSAACHGYVVTAATASARR